MRKMIFIIGLLAILLLHAGARAQTVEPDWVTRIDLIRHGIGDDTKAIRLLPQGDNTYDLVLVNLPEISLSEISTTLAKVPCGYMWKVLEDRIVIVPQGIDFKQTTELLSTLMLGDFGHVFFRYVPKELQTPKRDISRTKE